MKKKKQEQQINYLDLIPVKAEGLKWHKDFRDRVILEVKNEGFFNGIAQKVFTARKSQRYIWMYMEVIFGLLSMEREPSWIWLLWKKSGLVKRQNPFIHES